MGNSLSPIVANLYMEFYETKLITTLYLYITISTVGFVMLMTF